MPDVTGKKLDVAQSDIKQAGFENKVEVLGGGAFGVVKESRTPDMGRSGDGHFFVTVCLFGVSVSCYRGYS